MTTKDDEKAELLEALNIMEWRHDLSENAVIQAAPMGEPHEFAKALKSFLHIHSEVRPIPSSKDSLIVFNSDAYHHLAKERFIFNGISNLEALGFNEEQRKAIESSREVFNEATDIKHPFRGMVRLLAAYNIDGTRHGLTNNDVQHLMSTGRPDTRQFFALMDCLEANKNLFPPDERAAFDAMAKAYLKIGPKKRRIAIETGALDNLLAAGTLHNVEEAAGRLRTIARGFRTGQLPRKEGIQFADAALQDAGVKPYLEELLNRGTGEGKFSEREQEGKINITKIKG